MRGVRRSTTLCALALATLSSLCECLVLVDNCSGSNVLTARTGIFKLAQGQACTFHMSLQGAATLLLRTLQKGSGSTQVSICGDSRCVEELQGMQQEWTVTMYGRQQGVWVRIAAHDSNDFAATAIEWSTITYDCPTAADGTNIAVPLHLTDKGSGYPYFSHCVSGPQRELPQLSAHRSLSGVSDITPPPAMQPHDSQADMAALNTRDMLTEDHRSDSQSPQQFQAVHTASGSTQAVATAVRASGFESKEAASTLRFSYAWDLSQPDTELPHSLIWSGFDLDSDWIDTSHLAFKEGLYQMHMKLEPPELRFKVGLMHQPSLFTALFDSAVGLHATHFRFEEEGLARVKVMVQVPAGVSNGSVWLEVSPVAEMQPAPGAALITVRVREAAEYDSQATAEAQAAAHQHAGTPAAAQVRTRRLAMYSSQQQDTGARGFPTGWLLVLVVAVSAAFVLMRQR